MIMNEINVFNFQIDIKLTSIFGTSNKSFTISKLFCITAINNAVR